jgi:hypothetical protein
VRGLAVLAAAASMLACSTPDPVDDDVSPVCQPEHGQTGHDHS